MEHREARTGPDFKGLGDSARKGASIRLGEVSRESKESRTRQAQVWPVASSPTGGSAGETKATRSPASHVGSIPWPALLVLQLRPQSLGGKNCHSRACTCTSTSVEKTLARASALSSGDLGREFPYSGPRVSPSVKWFEGRLGPWTRDQSQSAFRPSHAILCDLSAFSCSPRDGVTPANPILKGAA